MKLSLALPAFACALILAGCATLPPRDRAVLQSHGVSPVLVEKMNHADPLTLPEIAALSRKHVPDEFIIGYVRSSRQTYTLTTDEVLDLTRAGVSKEVLDFLLTTPRLYALRNEPWTYPVDPFYSIYDRPTVIYVERRDHDHHHHRH